MLTATTGQEIPETGQFCLLQAYAMQLGFDRNTTFNQWHQTVFDGCQGNLAVLLKTCGLPSQFRILLTRTELSRQTGQTPPTVLPDTTQLEKDGRIRRTFRIGQQAFELFQALLPPERRTFLLAKLIGKTGPVALQAGEFALQLGAVPEQLQEPLVFSGLSPEKQLLGNGCHSMLQT